MPYERFYFDTLNGVESFMEVCWNNSATRDKMVRICIGAEKMVIRQEDLETYLLALTNNPSRYIRSSSKTVGIRYVPVERGEYRKYKEYKKWKSKQKS